MPPRYARTLNLKSRTLSKPALVTFSSFTATACCIGNRRCLYPLHGQDVLLIFRPKNPTTTNQHKTKSAMTKSARTALPTPGHDYQRVVLSRNYKVECVRRCCPRVRLEHHALLLDLNLLLPTEPLLEPLLDDGAPSEKTQSRSAHRSIQSRRR